jgi:hypothetical protein
MRRALDDDSKTLVSNMLNTYRAQTARENAVYDSFNKFYIDWKSFSVPAIKSLENPHARGHSDAELSRIWETGLYLQSKLAEIGKEYDVIKPARAEMIGVSQDCSEGDRDLEGGDGSRSTSPETANRIG